MLLGILFTAIFPGVADLSGINTVQRRLLSAAAAVVTSHYIPEHREIFLAHGLPYHGEQLRRLSAS